MAVEDISDEGTEFDEEDLLKHGFFIFANQQQMIVSLPSWSTEALRRRTT